MQPSLTQRFPSLVDMQTRASKRNFFTVLNGAPPLPSTLPLPVFSVLTSVFLLLASVPVPVAAAAARVRAW